MASGGNGRPSHVAGELFNMIAGVNIVHVPYQCLQHPCPGICVIARTTVRAGDERVIDLLDVARPDIGRDDAAGGAAAAVCHVAEALLIIKDQRGLQSR